MQEAIERAKAIAARLSGNVAGAGGGVAAFSDGGMLASSFTTPAAIMVPRCAAGERKRKSGWDDPGSNPVPMQKLRTGCGLRTLRLSAVIAHI